MNHVRPFAVILALAFVATACGSDKPADTVATVAEASPAATDATSPASEASLTESSSEAVASDVATAPGSDATQAASDGASPVAPYPVSVTSCGRSYTYNAPPARAIITYPSMARTFVELGIVDRLYGYSGAEWMALPAGIEGLTPVAPQTLSPKEAVLAARPDFVLADGEYHFSGKDGTASYDELTTAKVNVYVPSSYCDAKKLDTIDSLYGDITNIGTIFNVPDKAAALVASLKARTAAAAALRGDRPDATVAFVQLFDGKVYSNVAATYKIITDSAGVKNIFADSKEAFAEVSAEAVLARKPDIITVVVSTVKEADRAANEAKAIDEVKKLFVSAPAVANGKIVVVDNADISGANIGVWDAIDAVAKGAYGS